MRINHGFDALVSLTVAIEMFFHRNPTLVLSTPDKELTLLSSVRT